MTGTGGWTIAKGLKEQDPVRYELANLVVAWATFPQNNVRMAQFITYGPINKNHSCTWMLRSTTLYGMSSLHRGQTSLTPFCGTKSGLETSWTGPTSST